jgi:undecaprenyl pyrophosphate phosphatase UppP
LAVNHKQAAGLHAYRSGEKKMKKIIKFIKYDSFWTPVVLAACGVVIYSFRFIDIIEDNIHHLSFLAMALVLIAFILIVLGARVDWFAEIDKTGDDQD